MTAIFSTDQPELTKGMKIALIGSAVFHVSIVILGTIGLPYISKPLTLPPQAIAIEILNVADITTTDKKPSKSRLKPVPDKPKEQPKTEKMEAPPKVEAKVPPKIKPLEKIVEKKETVKPKPKTPPPPSAKLEKPKPPEKKVEDKEEAVQQEDPLASLMRNLQDSEEASEGDNPEKVASENALKAPIAEYVTQSELSALTNQLVGCWQIPIGVKDVHNMIVTLHIWANADRTVRRVDIQDQWRMANDSAFRALAESAQRAVLDPYCSPLALPEGKHNVWKDQYIAVDFDPSRVT